MLIYVSEMILGNSFFFKPLFKKIIFLKLISEMILMSRYGDMMSRPGSMMMGGGIGGYMPMSR